MNQQFHMHIILETPRLILRRFTEDDAALVWRLNSDEEVLKYLHEPVLNDENHARQIIRNIILPQYERNLGRWAMHTKKDMEFIGWCGLKYRPELDETDLGYRLRKDFWGKGFATESAKHSLVHAFAALKLQTVTGRAHIENLASLNVLEKIGMTYVCNEIVDECPVKTYIADKDSWQK